MILLCTTAQTELESPELTFNGGDCSSHYWRRNLCCHLWTLFLSELEALPYLHRAIGEVRRSLRVRTAAMLEKVHNTTGSWSVLGNRPPRARFVILKSLMRAADSAALSSV